MQVGEITTTPTTDTNLFPKNLSMIQYQDFKTQLTSHASTKQARSTATDYDCIPPLPSNFQVDSLKCNYLFDRLTTNRNNSHNPHE